MNFKSYGEFIAEDKSYNTLAEAEGDTGFVITAKDKNTKKRDIISMVLPKKEAIRFLQSMEVTISKMADKLQQYSELKMVSLSESLTLIETDLGRDLNESELFDLISAMESMDAVGQEDDDIDNDGDSDESDEYLKKKREAIAKATKESMDPVGKEDGDIDNDGDEDDSDDYLKKKREAIAKATK